MEGTIESPPMNFRWMLSAKFFSLNLSKKKKKNKGSLLDLNKKISSSIYIVHYCLKEKKSILPSNDNRSIEKGKW